MITIFHGDNISLSRNAFLKKRDVSANAITLDLESSNITTITQVVTGGDLFSDKKNIFIEEMLIKSKKIMNFEKIVELFNKYQKVLDITLWESKEIDKKTLNFFPNAKIVLFSYPKIIFQFLDSLKPHNTENILSFYHQTLKTLEPEIIFAMLIRQFRLLLALQDSNSQIDDLKRIKPWQQKKIILQSQQFGKEKLLSLYKMLYEIDHKQKTGKLTLSLNSTIDIFLLEI